MRGTVEVPSDAILRRLQLEPRRLAPEILELVALALLLGEDVQDAVEVVEDDPARRLRRLGAGRQQLLLLLSRSFTSSAIARAWRSLRAVQIVRKSV